MLLVFFTPPKNIRKPETFRVIERCKGHEMDQKPRLKVDIKTFVYVISDRFLDRSLMIHDKLKSIVIDVILDRSGTFSVFISMYH